MPPEDIGELIELFSDNTGENAFSIYRQDAGMGEHDYCVLLNGEFVFRADHHRVARNIVLAIRNTVAPSGLIGP